MALKKNEKILLAVGGSLVALMLIWTYAGSGDDDKTAKKIIPKNVVQNVKEKILSSDSKKLESKSKIRFDSWGRDPFRDMYRKSAAVVQEENYVKNLQVKGIIYRNNRPYVLINDLILTEGQEKEGLYIERITQNQVLCRKGGKVLTLTWKEEP